MPTRRDFIKSSAIVSAAIYIDAPELFTARKMKIGLQMYTLRKLLNNNNIADVLAKLSGIGFKEMEMFGYDLKSKFWGLEPKPFKKLLKANGLTAPSAHIAFENFLTGKDENELRLICDAAATVGNKYVVVAWLPKKYRTTIDDYQLLAEKLNKAGRIALQFGLQLAYHNHEFEFDKLNEEKTGYNILLLNTDKQWLKMELDLYWAVKAGVDPLELFQQHPNRFPLWHVKDMDKETDVFTEVGSGSINFESIFKQKSVAGLQHFFIEQDEVKKELFESVTESFQYVKQHLL